MTETEGPVQVKDLIIEKFEKLGYQKTPKIVETINGPKEITEYTKSFLTYSFKDPKGSSEYPLLLNIDFTKEPEKYGCTEGAKSFIFKALADGLTSTREKYNPELTSSRKEYNKNNIDNKKPLEEDYRTNGYWYDYDDCILIVDTNLEGIEYIEKVLEKLEVPDFTFKLDELQNSVQGRLLKELGFKISPGKNDFLVGDKPHIHVVHAPIKPGTKGKETYVNHEWKIKINAKTLLADKKNIEKYNKIIEEHGLHSYKEGNSFIEARPFPLETSPVEEFIVSRVNIPGLVEISKLFDPPSVEK